jgi:hypothetical protein
MEMFAKNIFTIDKLENLMIMRLVSYNLRMRKNGKKVLYPTNKLNTETQKDIA